MFNLFGKKSGAKPFVSAIIAAGGGSARMGGQNKLLYEIAGLPVLLHTLKAFDDCDYISEIILVARAENIVEYTNMASEFGIIKLTHVINGGVNRMESVLRGMSMVSEKAGYVAVHDAARPCVLDEEIRAVCDAAFENGSAVAVSPVTDTIKRVFEDRIVATQERSELFRAHTPQVADKALLYAALQKATETPPPVTDESQALERMGFQPRAVVCSSENIKITTPSDLVIAEMYLERR